MEEQTNENPNVKQTIGELWENLGTTGRLLLTQVRDSMEQGFNVSREEFKATVDRVAASMKASGEMASTDIERAQQQLKNNWETLQQENTRQWESFMDELKKRLEAMEKINRETFDMAVNQAKEAFDRHWAATDRVGEEYVRQAQKRSEEMADVFKKNWESFRDTVEESGKRWERAFKAFRDEMNK